ncbi:MAG: MerR family transcriptional regulator [Paludibacter sp.]|jgi:DNA-binding transcriptional MerR regulator
MEKLYYSISEVADMFAISQSNLRFWEKEFKQLKPKRNKGNTRFYTKEDIQIIKNIIFLVDEKKLTLEGAKKQLSQKKDVVEKHQEIVERLKKVRKNLVDISKEIDSLNTIRD